MRRNACLVMVLAAWLCTGHAQASEVTWRLAHYLQEEHFFPSGWLQDWIDTLEERTGGRLKIEVHPNNTLLRLGAIAPGVRDGKAEMGFGPAPDSSMLDLMELPFVANSAEHGTKIAMALLNEGVLDNDLKGLHTVFLQANAPSLLHTKGVAVRVPADLTGLRMRGATPYIRDVLGTLGAEPVADFLAPQVYGLLRDGIVDGTIWPYEAIRIFKLAEQANHHTEMYFFVSVLGLFINEKALNALPEDLRAIVLEMSGIGVAVSAAQQWDVEERIGRQLAVVQGSTIIQLSLAEQALWREAAQPLIDRKLAAPSVIDTSAAWARIQALSAQTR